MYRKGGVVTGGISHAINKVFDLLGAADTPARRGELARALQEAAWLQATNEGLKGSPRERRTKELLGSDPRPETVLAAIAMRAKSTASPEEVEILDAIRREAFNREDEAVAANNSTATQIAGRISEGAPYILPFSKVPTNMVAQGLEYTPVGGAYGAARALKTLLTNEPEAQRKAAVALGRSVTGLGLIYVGYLARKAGIASTPSAWSKGERDTQEATGQQASSIRIGNRWYSLKDLPAATAFFTGAMMADMEGDPSVEQLARGTASAAVRGLRDLPTLQGVTSVMDTMRDVQQVASDPDKSPGDAVANSPLVRSLAGAIVPAGYTSAAAYNDPYQRAGKGAADTVRADTRARYEMPVTHDALGRPSLRPSGAAGQVRGLSPDQSERLNDPATQEIARLRVALSKPTMVTNPKRADRDMSPAEYEDKVQRVGEATLTAVRSLMDSDWYKDASDEERKTQMEKSIKKARSRMLHHIKAEREVDRRR
jgi:hypothetical protein